MNADEIVRALRCSAEECSLTGACIRLDDGQLCKDINCQYMQERYETSAGDTGFDDMLSVAADLIESLQADAESYQQVKKALFLAGFESLEALFADYEQVKSQLAEITEKPELTSPVRYYTDGKPYVQIGGVELHDHPVTEACARLDRYEKYIIPHLQAQLDAAIAGQETLQWALAKSQRREKSAVEDLTKLATKPITPCHSCSKTCLFPASLAPELQPATWCRDWQWRGPQEAGEVIAEHV